MLLRPVRRLLPVFISTVRFDTDHLLALAAGAIPKIPLEEIRA
jgi:hypothetical protein